MQFVLRAMPCPDAAERALRERPIPSWDRIAPWPAGGTGASGAFLLVEPIPDPADPRALTSLFWSRYEAALAHAGGRVGPAPLAWRSACGRHEARCYPLGRSRVRRERRDIVPVVLAIRSIEIETGAEPGRHDFDGDAIALLLAARRLREAWPWMAGCARAGRFLSPEAGPAPGRRPALSIVAPPAGRRQPERYVATPWTPDRISLLRRMWVNGAIASEIADALGGVTKSSVIGKLTRLGLTGGGIRHDTPRRKGGRPTHRKGSVEVPAATA